LLDNYKTILETERLILRLPVPDDFEAFHSWGGNPENTRYMAWGPNDEEQTQTFLAGVKPGRDFAVVLKDTNAVIGSCGIYPNDANYMGDIGWILHKDYWKRGYGTELGGELIRYGFEDLKLGRIQAPCAAVNYGSYRIMERNGMRREALHRKAFWARVDKEWIDEARKLRRALSKSKKVYCLNTLTKKRRTRKYPIQSRKP
jgi:RimJ/RimL family protein N-acetyltransferase